MVWEVGPGSLGGGLGAVSGPTFWHICPQLGPTGPKRTPTGPNWPQEDPKRLLILVDVLYFFMANHESWALGPRA